VAVARLSDNELWNLIFDKTILNWVQTRIMREKIWFIIQGTAVTSFSNIKKH
jgi:hypothetical protein